MRLQAVWARARGVVSPGRAWLGRARADRRLLAAFVTVVLALVLGFEAWRRYEVATANFPGVPSGSGATFLVPASVAEAPSARLVLAPSSTTYILHFHSRSRCAPVGLELYGDAMARDWDVSEETRFNSQKATFVQHKLSGDEKILGQGLLIQACSTRPPNPRDGLDRHEFSIEVNTSPIRQMVARNGFRGTIWTPRVRFKEKDLRTASDLRQCLRGCLGGLGSPWSLRVDSGLRLTHFRVDNASPAADPDSPAEGPSWTFDSSRHVFGGIRASFEDLNGEAAADRDLFVSGVLAGVSGGLITWAIQLFFEATPARTRPGRPS